MTRQENLREIAHYYEVTEGSYRRWGSDPEAAGLYSLHFGYTLNGDKEFNNSQAIKGLNAEIIKRLQIVDGMSVLDAGCGTGAISFQIGAAFPDAHVVGINISPDQLRAAQEFRLQARIHNVSFSLQDYLQTGFRSATFDRAVFCESLTHAFDKNRLLQEVRRIVKPGGNVTIFDAFDIRDGSKDSEDDISYRNLLTGWSIPSVPPLREFILRATDTGFSSVNVTEYSDRVLSSAVLMGDHAEQRIHEGAPTTDVIHNSRLACIATRDLMQRKAMGYYAIVAS
jgi:ubiquinone/menaquinone biosynthesis C-methylase UbiE